MKGFLRGNNLDFHIALTYEHRVSTWRHLWNQENVSFECKLALMNIFCTMSNMRLLEEKTYTREEFEHLKPNQLHNKQQKI